MGVDEGTHLSTCQVYAACVMAFVACGNADKFSVYVPGFIEVSCAWVWTRQAPWCVPCASAEGVGCHEFAACVNVSICWLCTGMDKARTLVRALCNSSMSPVSSPLLHA